MIEWWWLIIESIGFVFLMSVSRWITRVVALCDALEDPDKAREEIARRWNTDAKHLSWRYRAVLPK